MVGFERCFGNLSGQIGRNSSYCMSEINHVERTMSLRALEAFVRRVPSGSKSGCRNMNQVSNKFVSKVRFKDGSIDRLSESLEDGSGLQRVRMNLS